jgi:hypothetical protein
MKLSQWIGVLVTILGLGILVGMIVLALHLNDEKYSSDTIFGVLMGGFLVGLPTAIFGIMLAKGEDNGPTDEEIELFLNTPQKYTGAVSSVGTTSVDPSIY